MATSSGPVTDSAARAAPPSRTKLDGGLDLGGEEAVGPGAGRGLAQRGDHGAGGGGGRERRAQVDAARGGQQLDREHAREPVDARGAACAPADQPIETWSSCIARARDRVDARRHGEPLELGDDRRLRVLGDHVARSRRPGRRPGTAAGRGCGRRRGSGRCGARPCSRRRRRRSPGSRARSASGAPWKLPLDSTRPSA